MAQSLLVSTRWWPAGRKGPLPPFPSPGSLTYHGDCKGRAGSTAAGKAVGTGPQEAETCRLAGSILLGPCFTGSGALHFKVSIQDVLLGREGELNGGLLETWTGETVWYNWGILRDSLWGVQVAISF